jgi:hypothetical protein
MFARQASFSARVKHQCFLLFFMKHIRRFRVKQIVFGSCIGISLCFSWDCENHESHHRFDAFYCLTLFTHLPQIAALDEAAAEAGIGGDDEGTCGRMETQS